MSFRKLALSSSKEVDRDWTLREIADSVGPDGHYLFILFLVLPFLQPIPVPGLSTAFGLAIAILAVRASADLPLWLLPSWGKKILAADTVSRITANGNRIYSRLAKSVRPRGAFLFRGPFRLLNLFLMSSNALLLALPLPIPFSNSIPAWMIFLQAIAHLERDGLFIFLSYLQTGFCFLYFGLIAKGLAALPALFDRI